MDNRIDDLLTPFDDNFANLMVDGLQSHYQDYQKINLYNTSITVPLHKIWVRTPKLRILKTPFLNEKTKFSTSIEFIIYRENEEQGLFYTFVDKLEKKVRRLLKGIIDKQKMRSCIRSLNDTCFIINIKCPINSTTGKFNFGVYNGKNRQVDPKNSLISGVNISSYIELTEIWVNDKEFGFNWNILQMKVYPDFNFSKCQFTDDPIIDIDDSNEIVQTPIKYIPPPPIMRNINDDHRIPAPPPPPPPVQKKGAVFIPSSDMLIKMKNLLKPVSSDNKGEMTEEEFNKELEKIK